MDNLQWLPIISHVAAITSFHFMLKDVKRYKLLLMTNVNSLWASIALHICILSQLDRCLFGISAHELYDHTNANLLIPGDIIYILPDYILPSIWQRELAYSVVIVLHVNYYLLGGSDTIIQLIYASMSVIFLTYVLFRFLFEKDYKRQYIPLRLILAAILGIVAAMTYFQTTGTYYWIYHSVWHTSIYTAQTLLLSSNRVIGHIPIITDEDGSPNTENNEHRGKRKQYKLEARLVATNP